MKLDELNTSENLQNKAKFVSFAKRSFGAAKKHKERRSLKVKENINYLQKIDQLSSDIENYAGNKVEKTKHLTFYSPILTTTVEKKAASAWIPEFTFEPEQTSGDGSDVYLARNTKKVHDFMLRTGGFYELKIQAAYDLFTAGRCFFYRGWETSEEDGVETPKEVKFRVPRYENVYWTKDKHTFFILEKYSPDELVYELGEGIKDFEIKEGTPFEATGAKIDFDGKEDQNKEIQVAYVFNDVQKVYGIIVGSGNEAFEYKAGDDYPWVNAKGKGRIPISWIDASNVMTDGRDHPVCDIDKISDVFRTYSVIMNTSLKRLEQSARSRRIIQVDGDVTQAKNDWMQSEADQAAGYDIPYFYRADGDGARKLGAQQLEFNPQLADALAMRDLLYDEATMATNINYRLQGQGAPTAAQEELRLQRELDGMDELIELNMGNWNMFVQDNIDMLRGVDAEFMSEHVSLEDEFTDQPMTKGATYEGSVQDVVDQLDEFKYNVKISIDNSNNKRKQVVSFQKKQALQTVVTAIGPGALATKLALDIVRDEFPNLVFDESELEQAPPQQPNEQPAFPIG